MKKRLLLATTLLSLLLAGCSIHYHGDRCTACGSSGGKGDPLNPGVSVGNGMIQVDQEVLRFPKDVVNVTITWRLPAKSNLRFPDNGVVFERAAAEEIVNCRRSEDGTTFTCLNRHTKPGYYKYGININEDGKPLKPLDPYVWND